MNAVNFLVLFWLAVLSTGRELPSFINHCRKDDPSLNECMKKALLDIKPHLKKGIPEMKIPPCDPFNTKNIVFKTNNVKIVLTDANLYNLDSFEVKNFEMDLAKNTIALSLYLPMVRLVVDYEINGKLLFIQLDGPGHGESNFTEIEGTMKLHGKRQEKNGKSYIKFDRVEHNLNIGSCHIYFPDFFRNNPEITQRTNDVLNENIQELIKEFGPLLEEAVYPVVFSFFKTTFDRYSVDELFL